MKRRGFIGLLAMGSAALVAPFKSVKKVYPFGRRVISPVPALGTHYHTYRINDLVTKGSKAIIQLPSGQRPIAVIGALPASYRLNEDTVEVTFWQDVRVDATVVVTTAS